MAKTKDTKIPGVEYFDLRKYKNWLSGEGKRG